MADDINGIDDRAHDGSPVLPSQSEDAQSVGVQSVDALSAKLAAHEHDDVHGQPRPPAQDAGQDEGIARRLERDPSNPDAKLDAGLDETMDASDPVPVTQPGRHEPAPSSGFDPEHEAALQESKE